MYKEDAVKAAVILGIKAADKMLPGEKTDMKIAEFAHYSLDIYLPNLSGLEQGSPSVTAWKTQSRRNRKRNQQPYQITRI